MVEINPSPNPIATSIQSISLKDLRSLVICLNIFAEAVMAPQIKAAQLSRFVKIKIKI